MTAARIPRPPSRRSDSGRRTAAGAAVHSLAAQGLRVLAIARRNVSDVPGPPSTPTTSPPSGTFIGLAGTPRPEAAGTTAALRAAGLVGRATGTPHRASTIALATLVGAELGQTLLLGGRDPVVLAAGLGSAAVLAAIIQVRGVSQLVGCRPIGPLARAIVLGCATAAMGPPALDRFGDTSLGAAGERRGGHRSTTGEAASN